MYFRGGMILRNGFQLHWHLQRRFILPNGFPLLFREMAILIVGLKIYQAKVTRLASLVFEVSLLIMSAREVLSHYLRCTQFVKKCPSIHFKAVLLFDNREKTSSISNVPSSSPNEFITSVSKDAPRGLLKMC